MKSAVYPLLLIFCFGLIACGDGTSMDVNDDSIHLVKFQDPKEGAFTVELPREWNVHIALERPQGMIRTCGVATSPDGQSKIFFGDPNLPNYYIPNPSMGLYQGMNMGSKMLEVYPYVEAEPYFKNYLERNYGRLPAFQITNSGPNPELEKLVRQRAQEYGMNPQLSTTQINFTYTQDGATRHGQINGTTLMTSGIWIADVNGFMTDGEPEDMSKLLSHATITYQTLPAWREAENKRNQQAMARSQAQHQQRMAARQRQFEAHQNMMKDRYAAADAQYQSWRNNQAIQDQSHEQFIDYLRDENTVTNGQYETKVQSGYNNYYVDPNTGNYFGTNSYENPDPSIYEHWNIKR
ncbi:MAG: hypothetical protein AAFN10_07445 [Bacteroidota bacterium]